MIIRIVKMTFMESRENDFRELCQELYPKIRNVEGCLHLDMLQDIHHRNIFFTYSHWESGEDLENYRRSDFFKNTWKKVGEWFKEKPQAWSTKRL